MEKDTQISTNRLFHYTNKIDNLLGILENGFKVFYSLEKNHLFDSTQNEYVNEFAIPMICFCDIPLKLVTNHTKLYGQYAIGLTKEWGERQAICPVIYLTPHGETTFIFKNMIMNHIRFCNSNFKARMETTNAKEYGLNIDISTFYSSFNHLSLFIKPFNGECEVMKDNITFHDLNYKFYDEREWRYVPSSFLCQPTITRQEYDIYKQLPFDQRVRGVITFEAKDITDIIVPKEEAEEIIAKILSIKKYKKFNLSKIRPL